MSFEVIVRVPNVYSGAFHNPLPWAERGERIRVVSALYANDLIARNQAWLPTVTKSVMDAAFAEDDAQETAEEDTDDTIRVGGRRPVRTKREATK